MLICIGEILVDIFDDGSNKSVLPGGAPFNVAVNSTLYTKDVYFVGAVGKDEYGKLLLDTARKNRFYRVDIKELEDRYTSQAIVTLNNGERSFRFNRDNGADYMLDVNDIDYSLIHKDDIVHIGSLMLSYPNGVDFFNKVVKKVKELGALVSFDINYRDDIFNSSKEAKEVSINALKQADILKFSNDELLFLSGKDSVEEALNTLVNKKQIAVITLGKDGSLFYKDGRLIHVESINVKPVDTTGAGDGFYSYFLSSLNNNKDFINDDELIKKYLKRANVVGAICTLKKGAINVAPTEEEIDSSI